MLDNIKTAVRLRTKVYIPAILLYHINFVLIYHLNFITSLIENPIFRRNGPKLEEFMGTCVAIMTFYIFSSSNSLMMN